jgi:hypothetical protein
MTTIYTVDAHVTIYPLFMNYIGISPVHRITIGKDTYYVKESISPMSKVPWRTMKLFNITQAEDTPRWQHIVFNGNSGSLVNARKADEFSIFLMVQCVAILFDNVIEHATIAGFVAKNVHIARCEVL